jgi:hypothetical protein
VYLLIFYTTRKTSFIGGQKLSKSDQNCHKLYIYWRPKNANKNSSLVNFVAAKSVKKEKDGLSVQIEVIMKLQFCKLA